MKQGTVITCSECKLPQIRSTKEILPGGKMIDGAWESVGWDMDGLRMGCSSCGNLWSRKHPITGQTQVHVDGEGWVSLDKKKDQPRKLLIEL